MQPILQRLNSLLADIQSAWDALQIDDLIAERQQLADAMAQPDFWNDVQAAQQMSQRESQLAGRITPWQQLRSETRDMRELAESDDESLLADITSALDRLQQQFAELKEELKYSGPYDDHDAIVSVHAGAGGTDAQDWAQMLLRMYVRWAERSGMKVESIDESAGEEAGIKSATFMVSGALAYGKLRLEHGVHRLVRLSPFNAESRETSFAKVEVVPRITANDDVQIDDADLRVDVYRSGGHGGQSVNTTDSAVRITHLPTGIVVAIQNERSQLQNKETAMTILRSRLAQLVLEQHAEKLSELKGPNEQAAWGNQIRSYVLHPYKQVKDLRSRYETSNIDAVLDGNLDELLQANLEHDLASHVEA